jgi:hypothetical protein
MIELNIIVTVYDKEDYWPHLKKVLEGYKKIKCNYVICYSGERENFKSDFKIKNVINGGRGDDNHPSGSPHHDMDVALTIGGYDILKNNGVNKWLKICVDSWLLDEEKILDILNFIENENCAYAGNVWYSHINLSTDIFFINTNKVNIFEELKKHGKKLLDWFYDKKIPTGFEAIMKQIVTPFDHAIILDREPITVDGSRWICNELGWCMSHDLETNIKFLKNYKSNNQKVKMNKIIGDNQPYTFEKYLKYTGQLKYL